MKNFIEIIEYRNENDIINIEIYEIYCDIDIAFKIAIKLFREEKPVKGAKQNGFNYA